ncbi:uncharacterized protein LY79DRAFT_556036 [Colletotrichum navitas]|uniref:Secreted protein n=1 Tax=Colletotrichum navitas TaxID=681940 RepID=A0AAD8PYF0_9PEZI|nr:uncharacterized protein LY79DRAFT_556036 [Colletotrichum navitas]KAK1589900.1 hypothetical protein LY79DRAFT_556036 [Colletotrichum navitas]
MGGRIREGAWAWWRFSIFSRCTSAAMLTSSQPSRSIIPDSRRRYPLSSNLGTSSAKLVCTYQHPSKNVPGPAPLFVRGL